MNVRSGDIILVQSTGIVGKAITRAQRRFGYSKEDSSYTHVGFIINHDGYLLEEEGAGIRLGSIQFYIDTETKFKIIRHKTADPEILLRHALDLSRTKKYKQRKYDFLLIVGLFLTSFGMPIHWLKYFNIDSRAICSEYVLEIFVRAKIIPRKNQKLYLPAEWNKWTREGFFDKIEQKK